MRIPRLLRVVATVGLAVAATTLAPEPASGQTTQTLSPGQAVTLTAPGIPLTPPADGRLNSYGTSVHIEGVAFASTIPGLAAGPGAQLVVLHLSTSWDEDTIDSQVPVTQQVSLAVRSGSLSAPLTVQDSYPSPYDAYYAAAVAKSGPADLTLSVAGLLPQVFDLRAGHRIGSTPSVLYRDANQPLVTVRSNAVSSFSATSTAGSATGQFGVSYAYLQYWQPFATVMAPSPGQAYLDVEFAKSQLSLPGYPSADLSPAGPLPAGSVKFELSDGQTITATADAPATQQFDLFSGDYYALVPADISSVKVTVDARSLAVQVPNPDGFTSHTITLTFASPLTATVTFPPRWVPAEASSHASPTRLASRPSGTRHNSSNGGFPVWLIALLVAIFVLAAAASAALRRRVLVPAAPLRWPPKELGPGATRVLSSPPRWALPSAADVTAASDAVPPVTVDGDRPIAPDPPSDGPAVMINLLGPVQARGLVKPIRRKPEHRMLIALAVTPERGISTDELAMIISGRPTADPKSGSMNTYASRLRSSLPPGVLPSATGDGYRLRPGAVVVDWLALAAVANDSGRGADWAERAEGALELVRGRPLEGASWDGIEPVVRTMIATIERLGRDLARHHLDRGDPARAEWAVARAMVAFEASVGLWQDRLEAAADGSGYGLERAWAEAQGTLGADSGLLAAFYQQLRRRLAERPPAST